MKKLLPRAGLNTADQFVGGFNWFFCLFGSADPQRSVIVCKTEAMCGLAIASYGDQSHGIKISLILKESDAFRIRD
jgi:hypothetical protein